MTDEFNEETPPPPALIITSVQVEPGPAHDQVSVWVSGQLGGTLTVGKGDGQRLAALLTSAQPLPGRRVPPELLRRMRVELRAALRHLHGMGPIDATGQAERLAQVITDVDTHMGGGISNDPPVGDPRPRVHVDHEDPALARSIEHALVGSLTELDVEVREATDAEQRQALHLTVAGIAERAARNELDRRGLDLAAMNRGRVQSGMPALTAVEALQRIDAAAHVAMNIRER